MIPQYSTIFCRFSWIFNRFIEKNFKFDDFFDFFEFSYCQNLILTLNIDSKTILFLSNCSYVQQIWGKPYRFWVICWEIRKVLSWMRNPESLILDEKSGKSYFGWEIQKVLSWIRNSESLILHERTQKSFIAWNNWKVLSYMRNTKRYMDFGWRI